MLLTNNTSFLLVFLVCAFPNLTLGQRHFDSGVSVDDSFKIPYPKSTQLRGVEFDFSTHRRLAEGSDNWPLTWAADGNQYSAWGDGGGFGGSNQDGRVKLGVARIIGDANNYRGQNVWGGKDAAYEAQFEGKSYGILSVDGILYMWVAGQPARHLESCRLAWSKDLGQHWETADWQFSRADSLSIPTFLNFGRDYAGARDEFIYSYFIHPTWGPEPTSTNNYGFDVHRPGQIYLARVHRNKIHSRMDYEFWAGSDNSHQPRWTHDLQLKRPVFEDSNGVGWNVSVSYSEPLGKYLLCTEHSATHVGNLGMFESPSPWGPWATVSYETGWGSREIEASTFFWSIPNRWVEPNGDFTMVFTGKNSNDSWNTVRGKFLFASAENASSTGSPAADSPLIKGIDWAPADTIKRAAAGSDNWPITWAKDGNLYAAYGDGRGFEPFVPDKLSLGIARITGGPIDFHGSNIRSSTAEASGNDVHGRKASGMLAVDDTLYMFVRNVNNSQLAWSQDYGVTWQWADWRFTTSFGSPTFLNFGQANTNSRDEYVYIYSSDSGSAYVPADRMVLARVPSAQIPVRTAYEFFVGIDERGQPTWSSEIENRGAVFEHPKRCYRSGISYDAALDRYFWCQVFPESSHPNGPRFQGGFGVFDAPEPWGPWTTCFFTNSWDVGPGETNSIPPKWISSDGLTIYLLFSGNDHFSVRQGTIKRR